ncbi:MAG: xanthine dehydrogenase accessory protein XdhC [Pseudomonadota bacterium]
MAEWLTHLREAIAKGPVAMVTILATEGSVPREAGARMVITKDTIQGSIGGGKLEFIAIDQARASLDETPGSWRVQDYPLGPLLNQCCGGRVRLLVEHLDSDQIDWLMDEPGDKRLVILLKDEAVQRDWQSAPSVELLAAKGDRPDAGAAFIDPTEFTHSPVLMFGAGHVGQAIMNASQGLPLDFSWYDNRPEMAGTNRLAIADIDKMVEQARHCHRDTPVLILTHDHDLDYQLLAAAMASEATFIGLIGSGTKRARFTSRLSKEGVSDADLTRLVCPIGLADVPGKQPEVIAIAVLAQLLSLRT